MARWGSNYIFKIGGRNGPLTALGGDTWFRAPWNVTSLAPSSHPSAPLCPKPLSRIYSAPGQGLTPLTSTWHYRAFTELHG